MGKWRYNSMKGDMWLASHSGHCVLGERALGTNLKGSVVGPRRIKHITINSGANTAENKSIIFL
jgi:hypothetical protein